jgi:GT2 family glycosyltransferase
MDLSIIIINFNTDDLLVKCLESVRRRAKGLEFEVIVVNVGSTDPAKRVEKFPFVRLIRAENRGFSAANNTGAEVAVGEVLLFLNSDTELLNGSLKEAVEQFRINPKLGLLIPRLELPDGSLQPGAYGQLPTVFSTIREKLRLGSDSDPDGPVEWVTGAALFIPRKVFDQVGGWDEQFFMYMEDVDLGARVKQLGLNAAYFPKLRILHRVGSSIAGYRDRKYYFHQSQNYYFRKHFGRGVEWLMRLLRFPYKLVMRLRAR